MTVVLYRLLSFILPIRVLRSVGRYGPLEIRWENGRKVVNSDRANQSRGSLHGVWQRCFRDARIRELDPAHVLVLGFGAGSVVDILRNELGLSCTITGVDGDPMMLRIAEEHFNMVASKDLLLVGKDAFEFVEGDLLQYELVIVDLFVELDIAKGVETPAFIMELKGLVRPGGVLCINTVVHDAQSAERSARSGRELRLRFDQVDEQRYEGQNRVFIAR